MKTNNFSTKKLPVTSIAGTQIEKDVQIPESVTTEEIFVPIGKSARDPLPSKGVMTANRNKITVQTGAGIPHTRIPTSIRFTEERHRSRTISIINEQKAEK
uniref:Reverse transcriptase domain-containing protein n=1 Tax=Elaeophora elaphi TaxID=1147741 RepID=A0A0R3S4U7_9BILA